MFLLKSDETKILNDFLFNASSVKWTVLVHFESQPRGQNFQAQT